MNFKRIFLTVLILACAFSVLTAQSRDRELTVEESYLQQSV